jgi:hypothetical protein
MFVIANIIYAVIDSLDMERVPIIRYIYTYQ